MRLTEVLFPGAVLTRLAAADDNGAIAALLYALARYKSVDVDKALRDVSAREDQGATLIPCGVHNIAIPHASTTACKQLLMAIGISRDGVPWGNTGKRAHLIVLFIAPPNLQTAYLRALSRIAKLFHAESFLRDVLHATTADELLRLFRAAEIPLGDMADFSGEMPTFGVVGISTRSLATAGLLALAGCRVTLLDEDSSRLEVLRARNGIQLFGEASGFAGFSGVVSDVAAVSDADVLIFAGHADEFSVLVERVSPYIKDGQILIVSPGGIGGAIELAQIVRRINPNVRPYFSETQGVLCHAKVQGPARIWVSELQTFVPLGTFPAFHATDVLPVLRKALPQLVPQENSLKTGMEDVMGFVRGTFGFVKALRPSAPENPEGSANHRFSAELVSVLEDLDRERTAVARALGLSSLSTLEWTRRVWNISCKTLAEALSEDTVRDVLMPPDSVHSTADEFVRHVLVPLNELGTVLNVSTATAARLVQAASDKFNLPYALEGRTLARMGLDVETAGDLAAMLGVAAPPAHM